MLFRITFAIALFAYAHQTQASEADAARLCRGDAFRFCLDQIPDREGIATCLQHNKAHLSPGCQTMFNQPVTAPAVLAAGK